MKPPSPHKQWQTPFGTFTLTRYPCAADNSELAWSSADDLLLEDVYRRGNSGSEILAVNDAHGALCIALQPLALWTDSALSVLALRQNESANHRANTSAVWSTEAPLTPTDSAVNLVVLRIPKQLPFFEFQLEQLARTLPFGATVLAAGMDKHLSPHTATILERLIGPTQRFPGKRKARLFSAHKEARPAEIDVQHACYFCEPLNETLQALPNVFSRDRLDMGSRLLLEQLTRLAPAETLIDLACGNGVLGLAAFKQGLAREVVFCDESSMAIRSSQLNAALCFPDAAKKFTFHLGDGLRAYAGKRADLILCNPPFHREHTVDAFVGRRLLQQCAEQLSRGGRLCLVANRHLTYRKDLEQIFGRVEKIAGNSKFNVFLAHKS